MLGMKLTLIVFCVVASGLKLFTATLAAEATGRVNMELVMLKLSIGKPLAMPIVPAMPAIIKLAPLIVIVPTPLAVVL